MSRKHQRSTHDAPAVEPETFAEHFANGDWLEWAAPPRTRSGQYFDTAPSAVGVISLRVGNSVLVSFWANGELMNPVSVVEGQPAKKTGAKL